MKHACPSCGKEKARRLCARHGNVDICSKCCAETRDADCGACVYYPGVRDYEIRRAAPRDLPDGHFVIEINPEIEAAVDRALDLVQSGQRSRAAGILEELIQKHPRNHLVCFGLGTLHAMGDDSEQAIQWFDKALAEYPYLVEAHFNKAMAYQKMMNIGGMIHAFRKVIQYGDPYDKETLHAKSLIDDITASIRESDGVSLDAYLDSLEQFNRAFVLMEAHDWEGARKGFRSAIKANPANAPSHGNLGLCLAYLGRKVEALASFDRALELDPEYQPARTNRLALEKLAEGQPLNVELKTVNFGLERIDRE